MTERVLPYDRTVVPQETGYDCGPASTQVVLNGRGVIQTETELIEDEHTTYDGTGDVNDIAPALNYYLPGANYTTAHMPDDPPTQAQKDALWSHLTASIDAGRGLVANFCAPPSNYPIGVKGSQSPAYGGGVVNHYVAPMGYDDAEPRAVWIADPGFRPFGYWISFEQFASLIPPHGYAYANAAPVAAPQAADGADSPTKVLFDAVPVIDMARAGQLVDAVAAGLALAECNTVQRIAMFLAQTGEESDGFNTTQEYGTGQRYAPYIGRTWIQITWQANYALFGQWAAGQGLINDADYFVNNPAALADLKWAGIGAAWYWTVARPTINSLCDQGDIVGVTQLINGGQNGIDQRRNRYQQAIALGDRLLLLIAPKGPLMALSDAQQQQLLDAVLDIQTQLRGPGLTGWPELGQRADGNGTRTPVDALAHLAGNKDA